ncbi:MAG: polyamine ABC transporter ATP-binding protein [Pelagibacteraceae bacterium TMED237]|nr:MAG: polyamine ABC transporter ATP-binding protein [Pelagibacteraceae bacterium TMED237]
MDNAFLKIEGISKSFGSLKVLDNINLNISKSEFFGLLGASGSGKTTLLRILGGFEKPDSGKIFLDDNDITNLESFERPLNYMFQSYALFPHLNVYKNLEFGIKDLFNNFDIKDKVNRISNLLSIEKLLDRRIFQLSGGEQQRVALGRCLIKEPKLLLLDEPLAALDKKLRSKTQLELTTLQKKLGITFVFVTHDQEEAMSLSDKMAIMKDGKIIEHSNPENIYENPKTLYTANFVGIANILKISKKNNSYFSDELQIPISMNKNSDNNLTILIRPEKIKISSLSNDIVNSPNSFAGKILEKSYLGSFTRYEVISKNKVITVLDQNFSNNKDFNFPIGTDVFCNWKKESIKIVED